MEQENAPLNLHETYWQMTDEACFDHEVILHPSQAGELASRLRGIKAVTAVLIAGCDEDVLELGNWMRGGLVTAAHILAKDAFHALDRIAERARIQQRAAKEQAK